MKTSFQSGKFLKRFSTLAGFKILKIPSYWADGRENFTEDFLAGVYEQGVPFSFCISSRNRDFTIRFWTGATAFSEESSAKKTVKNFNGLKASFSSSFYDFPIEEETPDENPAHSSAFSISGMPEASTALAGYVETVTRKRIDADYVVFVEPASANPVYRIIAEHEYKSSTRPPPRKADPPGSDFGKKKRVRKLEETLNRYGSKNLFKASVVVQVYSDVSRKDANAKKEILKTALASEFSGEKERVEIKDVKGQTDLFESRKKCRKTLVKSSELSAYLQIPRVKMAGIETYTVPNLSVPARESFREGISLGEVLRKDEKLYPCRIKKEDLFKHVSIFGINGSGKTVLAKDLIERIINELDVPVCILDRHGEYRELADRCKKPVAVLNHKITPYTMALLERPKWLNLDLHVSTILEFLQIISDYWGDNMTAILRRELYSLYENKKEPKISDLISLLKDVKKAFSREKSYRDTLACDSLINRLEPLTFGELARVFDTPHTSIDPEFIVNNSVIFEINTFGVAESMDILSLNVLKLIYDYKFTRNQSREELQEHVIIVEEAQNIVRKGEGKRTELIEKYLSEMRKFREGLILITQRAAKVSEDLIGNVNTVITARQQLDHDRNLISKSIATTREEQLHVYDLLVSLPTFHYIVKMNGVEKPFMIEGSGPADSTIPCDGEVRKLVESNYPELLSSRGIEEIRRYVPLSELELTIEEEEAVKIWNENPEASLTEIYQRLGIATGRAFKVVASLVEKKMLFRKVEIKAGKSRKTLIVPTERGREYFRLEDKNGFLIGGSEEHKLGKKEVIRLISGHFDSVREEAKIPGTNQQTDVLAENGKIKLAFEYETGYGTDRQILKNYDKNLIHDLVVFVAKNDMVKSRLLQLLSSKKKIRITTVERLKNPGTLNNLTEIVGALSKGGYYLYTKKKIL